MKKVNIIITSGVLFFAITSCKNTEKESVNSSVDNYITYVDSITGLSYEEAESNWNAIETSVALRKQRAEKQILEIKDNSEFEKQIKTTSGKYEAYRETFTKEWQENDMLENPSQSLRNSLFKDQIVGSDLNFNWVNKGNILNVYDYFVTTVTDNKDSYSTEQWEEIKKTYEALDERKNTVENEGLTSEDNLKIAALKLKFAPLYKIEKLKSDVK